MLVLLLCVKLSRKDEILTLKWITVQSANVFLMSVLNRDGIKLRSKNCHIWGGKTKEGLNLDIVPIFVFCLKVIGVGAVQKRTDSSLFYFLLRILSTVLNFCSTNTGACIISSEKQFEGNSCVMTSCLLWMEATSSYKFIKLLEFLFI